MSFRLVGWFRSKLFFFLSCLFAESRFQNDANQPDWIFEWEKCSRIHGRTVAPAVECTREHRWDPLCFPRVEEGRNKTETSNSSFHIDERSGVQTDGLP